MLNISRNADVNIFISDFLLFLYNFYIELLIEKTFHFILFSFPESK